MIVSIEESPASQQRTANITMSDSSTLAVLINVNRSGLNFANDASAIHNPKNTYNKTKKAEHVVTNKSSSTWKKTTEHLGMQVGMTTRASFVPMCNVTLIARVSRNRKDANQPSWFNIYRALFVPSCMTITRTIAVRPRQSKEHRAM